MQGGNPEIVRESQRRRNPVDANDAEDKAKQQEAQNQAVAVVDEVIKLDEDWVRRFPTALCRCPTTACVLSCGCVIHAEGMDVAVAYSAKPNTKQSS
eukprot:COSAG02_NODE_4003_length_5927_cov_5.624914_3_plen_97_part_00